MEELKFDEIKKTHIRILAYKKVKVGDDVLDVLHLDDIAEAWDYVEENKFKIISGQYKDKYIDLLDGDYESKDFVALPLTLVEKNLVTDFNPNDESLLTIDNYKKKCKDNEYLILTEQAGRPALQITTDERIINEFKTAASPSLTATLSNLIEESQRKGTNGFAINPATINKILGKTNSLIEQDERTKSHSLKDYNIGENYINLKKKIIGLDEELKILLANITKNISLSYTNMEPDKVREIKSTLLILGESGSGKSFMIRNIAKILGVPFVITDSTRYSPAAYKGADIEDILVNLFIASKSTKEEFEHSIIFLDEFDKICRVTDPKDYSLRETLQNELLTVIEGTIINKKIQNGFSEKTITLDTSKITFVLSGAFEEIINKDEIKTDDLVMYGMIRQLANRIHTTIKTTPPSKDNLKEALVSGEYSYLKLFEEYLHFYNKTIEVDDDFIDYIVEIAYSKKSGYRGLSAALTEYLNILLFDIIDGKTDVVKLSKKEII